ncbi:YuzB family protein [Bacillus sp. Marseille-P3661]|uniref:YuzB family protein n=1 Tax=Bacillus sp. Marseille-P3661 TaxID=1936234 RepID=UPI002155E5C5|nr:YuzB family protein [Bacillus sp. Marseille-P3661]
MKFITNLLAKNKKVQIEFCEKNLDRFLIEENMSIYNEFLTQKNVMYKEYQCQSKCEICSQTPYAIVDGEMVKAGNSSELLKKLKQIVPKT